MNMLGPNWDPQFVLTLSLNKNRRDHENCQISWSILGVWVSNFFPLEFFLFVILWNIFPLSNLYVEVVTPSSSEHDLFGDRVVAGRLKMRSYWRRVGPSSNMTGNLIKKGNLNTKSLWGYIGKRHTYDDKGRDGVIQNQHAKEHRGLSAHARS